MFSSEGSQAFQEFLEEAVGPCGVTAGPKTMLLFIAAYGPCSDADVIKRATHGKCADAAVGEGILGTLRKMSEWFTYENGFWGVTSEGLDEAKEIFDAQLAGQDEML